MLEIIEYLLKLVQVSIFSFCNGKFKFIWIGKGNIGFEAWKERHRCSRSNAQIASNKRTKWLRNQVNEVLKWFVIDKLEWQTRIEYSARSNSSDRGLVRLLRDRFSVSSNNEEMRKFCFSSKRKGKGERSIAGFEILGKFK